MSRHSIDQHQSSNTGGGDRYDWDIVGCEVVYDGVREVRLAATAGPIDVHKTMLRPMY